jgi:indole-3-glycerol phosphate synthase
MSNRLTPILEARRAFVAKAKMETPLDIMLQRAAAMPPTRGFRNALLQPGLNVIAEVKRASPSQGAIRTDADPVAIAQGYERAGAAAISVLTEPDWFHGSLEDMQRARAAISIPVIRKDFTVDLWQIAESRAAGADAVLLIVAALGQGLKHCLTFARQVGIDALTEVHTREEMDIALAAGADLIGVNNRDLTTFEIDLAVSERLRPMVPAGIPFVAESGIATPADMQRMKAIGAHAVLIGTALMSASDPFARLAALRAA